MTDKSTKSFLATVILSTAALTALLIADNCTSQTECLGTVTIIDKSFVPSMSSSGMGMSMGSGRSGMSPVLVSSSSPERFTLLLKGNGDAFTMTVSRDLYSSVSVGEEVSVFQAIGGVTGSYQGSWVNK